MVSTRPFVVTDPSSAKLLLGDSRRRHLLLSFVPKAHSIGEVATTSGLPMARAHYMVTDLARRGLLKLERVVPRAGRAIRFYRASASAFFIPMDMVATSPGFGLASELRERLDVALSKSGEDGILFDADQAGRPRLSWFQGHTSASVAELWRMPALSGADARSLVKELKELLDKYEAKASGSTTFLVHAAVVPRT